MAEACAKLLAKGSKVAVTATARTRSWQYHNGNKRINIDFVADEIKFFTTKSQNNAGTPVTAHGLEELAADDELPFN